MYKLLISFGIYTYFFINRGTTVFRRDSNTKVCFSLIPLFTIGFVSPIKTIFNFIKLNEFYPLFCYLKFESTNLANPYTCYYLVNFFNYILIKNNLIS